MTKSSGGHDMQDTIRDLQNELERGYFCREV
jgi:hypothetical protein